MSAAARADVEADLSLARTVFDRLSGDVAMVTDREIAVLDVSTERVHTRPAGRGRVHVSFRQVYQVDGQPHHGCVLVPLPDALCLAGYLMMVPDEAVEKRREDTEPDSMTKDALLEMGNFMSSAIDGALREDLGLDVAVRSAGCQGVRADVRPAFPYEEGSELLAVTASTRIHQFPACDLILLVPAVAGLLD